MQPHSSHAILSTSFHPLTLHPTYKPCTNPAYHSLPLSVPLSSTSHLSLVATVELNVHIHDKSFFAGSLDNFYVKTLVPATEQYIKSQTRENREGLRLSQLSRRSEVCLDEKHRLCSVFLYVYVVPWLLLVYWHWRGGVLREKWSGWKRVGSCLLPRNEVMSNVCWFILRREIQQRNQTCL